MSVNAWADGIEVALLPWNVGKNVRSMKRERAESGIVERTGRVMYTVLACGKAKGVYGRHDMLHEVLHALTGIVT